jgi:tetratricopeptide (TPR) repeat protein
MPVLSVLLVALAVQPPPAPAPPAPPPSQAAQSEAYYEFIRGRVLEGEGDGDAAVEALRRAAARDTGSAEIRAELAGLLARAGREDEAMTAANEALQRDPANTEAHWVLGTLYASRLQRVEQSESAAATADIASAIGHLEQARPNRKYDLGLLLTLGRLQLARGNAQAAIEPLNALWQQEPGVADAGLMLAQAYEGVGKPAEAIGVLRDVVTIQPRFVRAWTSLATLLEAQGDSAGAADAYRQAAAQSPRSADLRLREASSWLAADQPARAREVLRELVTQSPTDGNVLYLLSEAERRSNDLAEAEAAARRLVALEPTGLRGAYSLALAFEQRRAYREVVETLAPAIDKQPAGSRQVVAPLVHLAFAHQELGDFPAAIAAFERARALNPADASLGMYVGQALLASKQYEKAATELASARRGAPSDLRLARLEAQAWRGQGQIDRAVAILRPFVDAPGATALAFTALANLYGDAKRYDDAVRVLADAEAKFADDPDLPFQRGAIFEQQKRYAEAEAAFRVALARDPLHAPTLNYFGYMLVERGQRLDEAIQMIERALVADPHNGSYLDSLGWALFRKGDAAKAVTHLATAAAQMPMNSIVQDHHGDVLLALGDRAAAVAAWKRALAGDREQIDAAAIQKKIDDAERMR